MELVAKHVLTYHFPKTTHLASDDKVCKKDHGICKRDEVCHRFHDIPGVHPPSEPGQRPALNRQQG